jgi:gluconokinase
VERESVTGEGTVNPANAADPVIMAVDVGTSSARALVFDGRGRQVLGWEAHHPYTVTTVPGGGVVLDPEALVDVVVDCVDAVLATMALDSRRILAVACDTFWHSLVGIDKRGKSVTPVYTWADTRSGEAARSLRRDLDERAVHARTGAVLHSSYLPAKLVWINQSDPHLAGLVRYWLSFGEYLYLRLFGERRVSLSMASGTGLFDQNRCDWDEHLLDALPLTRDQLSPIAEFSDAMQGLRHPFSDRWPALANVPWNLALGDGACNNVGSGGFCDEWAVAMIGTSGALRVAHSAEKIDIPWGLWAYRVDRRMFVLGGALSDGGNVFAWLERTLRLDVGSDLERELAEMAPDSHGLTVLPFLAGERSPFWNVDARSALVGMTLDTGPTDIARASLESVAYRFGIIQDILKEVVPGPRGIIGSGAGLIHSPAWMQIMSDVLGEPVVTSAVREASSRGAALLALTAMGAISDLGDAPAPLGMTHAPRPENTPIYRAAMQRQQELYKVLIGQRSEGDAHSA